MSKSCNLRAVAHFASTQLCLFVLPRRIVPSTAKLASQHALHRCAVPRVLISGTLIGVCQQLHHQTGMCQPALSSWPSPAVPAVHVT